jgi:hypothetical protein
LRKLYVNKVHRGYQRYFTTSLYQASLDGYVDVMGVLQHAGALINMEGGPLGTPVMAAARAGRHHAVHYLVRTGAMLQYMKGSQNISAIAEAKKHGHERLLRWLLVGRFADQPKITHEVPEDSSSTAHHPTSYEEYQDVMANDLSLVFFEDIQAYLDREEKRQERVFTDCGDGSFASSMAADC